MLLLMESLKIPYPNRFIPLPQQVGIIYGMVELGEQEAAAGLFQVLPHWIPHARETRPTQCCFMTFGSVGQRKVLDV